MFAGSEEGLNRRPLVSLSVIAGAMRLLKAPNDFPKGENNDADSASQLRNSDADFDPRPYQRLGSRGKRQELPHGATMPLGEFQKGLRKCESVPLEAGRSQCELSFTFGMSHDDRADGRCGAPTHEHEAPPASRQLAHGAPLVRR